MAQVWKAKTIAAALEQNVTPTLAGVFTEGAIRRKFNWTAGEDVCQVIDQLACKKTGNQDKKKRD